MAGHLRSVITASDAALRNESLDSYCRQVSLADLLEECEDLDRFRRDCDNLYERVRALFFLYAIHRFHLPQKPGLAQVGHVPYEGYQRLLIRRFEEAISRFQAEQKIRGPSDALSSALAAAYHHLGFQTLADQVRRSVRGVRGNQWMFRVGHPADHPLRVRAELLQRPAGGPFPVLHERTPVRMDLSHSGWSDIFFLGMDYPEGARVCNISIDLAVHGRDAEPRPPVEIFLRVLDEPVLRLVSVDLGAAADITTLAELFDFARDYLGLLKAAVIAAGIVPPGLEGSEQDLRDLLARLIGSGLGLEVVSSVNNIPKGSRLAVSTTLLASLIAACMRATGQARSLTGPLAEDERRLVAARAILGEWLGGSGGGWQDSGGTWPGVKRIEGVRAQPGDQEYGISRGCLLPRHYLLDDRAAPPAARQGLKESLVLVHGGMAQNVGPILEMVTEKYLLRSEAEWAARRQALGIFDDLLAALSACDARSLGALTTRNFQHPIQTIIPWASNYYTERLIDLCRRHFAEDFWGFWMLGGMSGGGMGFLFAPARKDEAQEFLQQTMSAEKRELEHSLPFAMEPVVYDFAINPHGTHATLLRGEEALLPPSYYALQAPGWLRQDPRWLTPLQRDELDRFGAACRTRPKMAGMIENLFDRLLPRARKEENGDQQLESLLKANGFDSEQHERIRSDLRRGLIGLAQNRLPASAVIEDVQPGDVVDTTRDSLERYEGLGREALAGGAVAVVTLAAGAGSRWTHGAGVVKALHPFCKLGGRHRTFLEAHLAKSRRVGNTAGKVLPHIVTTSYLTHAPIAAHLEARRQYGYPGSVYLSPGRAVGLRLTPMVRDLRFAWQELAQQRLDEQAQKVRDSLQAALLAWAEQVGEGSDYTDNIPLQCLHPVGHWFEVPNLFRNGTLAALLAERPGLRYLLVHNVDTLGADVDPCLLGLHIDKGRCLTFEVIPRRVEDRGGGLARVGGRVRLVEGTALPREEDEFVLSYYNTLTTWVDVDRLLSVFGLTRAELADEASVTPAIRRLAQRVPTYITLKDVKKRWGYGQEDVFPLCQFEKLWGDMTALPEVDSGFVVVPRLRGQQLKDPAQLDGWLRDGSAAYVEGLCAW
jgi:UTP--glucose-1-phosphate uridylyltransferase